MTPFDGFDLDAHDAGCTCPECSGEECTHACESECTCDDDAPTAAELRDHDRTEYAAMVRASMRTL